MKIRRKLLLISGVIIVAAALFIALVLAKVIHINYMFVSEKDIVGADISEYQNKVDMDILSQNVDFVYIRATEGSSYRDMCFEKNWEYAHKAGLICGAYHFFSFDSGGETQAKNFIETVGKLEKDLVPVVDIEYYGDKAENPPYKQSVLKELHIFLDALEKEYGVRPMIYTLKNVYDRYLRGEVNSYPLWVRNVYYPAAFDNWENITLWQYTDTAQLNGYSGGEKYIDLDVLAEEQSLEQLMVVSE